MIPWYLIGINVCHVMSEMSGRDSELIFLSEKQTNKQTNKHNMPEPRDK